MSTVNIEAEAWRLLLSGAESYVEDALDEDDEFTEADYDAVVERAMALIYELRRQHVPNGNDGESQASEPAAEPHVIEFRAAGWTIMHPLACRPNLFACPVNRAAEQDLTEPPGVLGRFECDLNGLGEFLIGDRVEAGRG